MIDETNDGENVVKLPVRFAKPPDEDRVLLGPYETSPPPPCNHLFAQYLIDPSEAEVVCGRCRTRLNPMWVLGRLATEDRRYADNRKASKEASARLAERKRCKCEHCGKMTGIKDRR